MSFLAGGHTVVAVAGGPRAVCLRLD
jgi:hypothetical protein